MAAWDKEKAINKQRRQISRHSLFILSLMIYFFSLTKLYKMDSFTGRKKNHLRCPFGPTKMPLP